MAIASVTLPSGEAVPALGQGTWKMDESARVRAVEVRALQLGLDLGMTLIDTAEMYASGGAEEVTRDAMAGRRHEVFLVSKVLPQNASRAGTIRACEQSLKRLGTDRIDLYLLHWRGTHAFADTLAGFVALKEAGKIRYFGVSNLDTDEMDEWVAAGGEAVAADQVVYNLTRRGIEFDLLPWSVAHNVPVMAYSPVEQGRLASNGTLQALATARGVTAAQIALAFVLAQPNVIAIPKATDPVHVRENRAAADIVLTLDELAALDSVFPPPRRKAPLEMI